MGCCSGGGFSHRQKKHDSAHGNPEKCSLAGSNSTLYSPLYTKGIWVVPVKWHQNITPLIKEGKENTMCFHKYYLI